MNEPYHKLGPDLYGCTFSKCQRTFQKRQDWEQHENSEHYPLKTWLCDEKILHGKVCRKACYSLPTFEDHLLKEHCTKEETIKEKIDTCRIGGNFQHCFWCGFCTQVIATTKGIEAWILRFDHIEDHFLGRNQNCQSIQEWISIEKFSNQQPDPLAINGHHGGIAKPKRQRSDSDVGEHEKSSKRDLRDSSAIDRPSPSLDRTNAPSRSPGEVTQIDSMGKSKHPDVLRQIKLDPQAASDSSAVDRDLASASPASTSTLRLPSTPPPEHLHKGHRKTGVQASSSSSSSSSSQV